MLHPSKASGRFPLEALQAKQRMLQEMQKPCAVQQDGEEEDERRHEVAAR